MLRGVGEPALLRSRRLLGQSWIISPEGELLAETTARRPFVTVEIDLRRADSAKATYPRNLAL